MNVDTNIMLYVTAQAIKGHDFSDITICAYRLLSSHGVLACLVPVTLKHKNNLTAPWHDQPTQCITIGINGIIFNAYKLAADICRKHFRYEYCEVNLDREIIYSRKPESWLKIDQLIAEYRPLPADIYAELPVKIIHSIIFWASKFRITIPVIIIIIAYDVLRLFGINANIVTSNDYIWIRIDDTRITTDPTVDILKICCPWISSSAAKDTYAQIFRDINGMMVSYMKNPVNAWYGNMFGIQRYYKFKMHIIQDLLTQLF